ncbi:MAG: polysaccharide deacetylase family protein [Longimicrobiales bacterium]
MSAARVTLLAWGLPAALVLAISAGLMLRQTRLAAGPEPERFSGSSVVLAMPSLLASPQLPTRLRVAVIRDASAADFYPAPATLDTIVRAWRDALAEIGAEVSIVSPAELRRAASARVLVIPASPCLSVATREAIERAGARGQGLLVTGAVGIHDAGCRPLGYGLLVSLTGASRAQELRDRSAVYIAVPYGGPLSLDVPPGARVAAHPAGQIALRGATRDAIYSRYDLRPAPADGSPLLDAAMTRHAYRGARVVYWGFELRDVVDAPWNRAITALLVRNSVAWAAALPLAAAEPWPHGRRAAVVLAQETEEPFADAHHAADSLSAIGIPATFFIASRGAAEHRQLVESLRSRGEVSSHTEYHGMLGGRPADEQRARLQTTQREMTALIGRPVAGLRPPEEQFDRATMAGWLAAGGSYLLGANDWRSVAPELLPIGRDTLVLVPRIATDDLARDPGFARDTESAERSLSDEFAHVRALGGLYTLSYHSRLLGRPEHVPLLARLARSFANDTTVWVAPGSAVADWWKARASLKAVVRAPRTNRLDLTVRNRSALPIWGAVVRVTLPPGRAVVRANADLLAADTGTARVSVPYLDAGAARTISLILGPGDDP